MSAGRSSPTGCRPLGRRPRRPRSHEARLSRAGQCVRHREERSVLAGPRQRREIGRGDPSPGGRGADLLFEVFSHEEPHHEHRGTAVVGARGRGTVMTVSVRRPASPAPAGCSTGLREWLDRRNLREASRSERGAIAGTPCAHRSGPAPELATRDPVRPAYLGDQPAGVPGLRAGADHTVPAVRARESSAPPCGRSRCTRITTAATSSVSPRSAIRTTVPVLGRMATTTMRSCPGIQSGHAGWPSVDRRKPGRGGYLVALAVLAWLGAALAAVLIWRLAADETNPAIADRTVISCWPAPMPCS